MSPEAHTNNLAAPDPAVNTYSGYPGINMFPWLPAFYSGGE
jgi:hypothetical protein